MNPQFPIFIPSKSRADRCITMRHLDALRVPYRVIVEADQYADYAAVLDPACLMILPDEYKADYVTGDDLPRDAKPLGSGPARNFAWATALKEGAPWHWIMDDNIRGFWRLNRNLKTPVGDGTVFRAMEDFALRYDNVAQAGPAYYYFTARKDKLPPLVFNTRLFSCILMRNDIPFRWECRLNEDLDLSLRILKAGWVTIQFNAFLQYKIPTQLTPGGNMEAFYSVEGTGPKSEMIVRRHPDVARLAWRYNRWHHHCDYRQFKTKPHRRAGLTITEGVDEYGMQLINKRQPRRPHSDQIALERKAMSSERAAPK